ncbi:MAG: hypothetical protein QOF48_133 [Verrucomicrobiota bacterium]
MHGGKLVVHLNAFEARLLDRVFRVILKNYELKPADLDPAVAEVWYATRGCRGAQMSAEETGEWLSALHQLKSDSIRRLEVWAGRLSASKPGGHRLALELGEADVLLKVLNDYRMMVAARQQLGEAEMNLADDFELLELPPGRRIALMEIDILGALMEQILAALLQD